MKVYVLLRRSNVHATSMKAVLVKLLDEDLELYAQAVEVDRTSSGGRYKFKGMSEGWWKPEKVYTTPDAAREAVRDQYREEIAKLEEKLAHLKEKLAGEISIVGDTCS